MNMVNSMKPMQKGEVPDAWRKLLAIQHQPPLSPYDRYSEEGLRKERKETARDAYEFWSRRVYGGHSTWRKDVPFLFSHPWYWRTETDKLEGRYYTLLFPEVVTSDGNEVFKPNERVLRLFVLLTEPKCEFDHESAMLLRATFTTIDGIIDKVDRRQLVTILHLDALTRLAYCLNGKQIAELLNDVNSYGEELTLIEKIATSLSKGAITQLGNYLAVTPFSSALIRQLQEAGKKGAEVAIELIKHLEDTVKRTKETLESLTKVFTTEPNQ